MNERVPLPQLNQSFASAGYYRSHCGQEYALLPLRFILLDSDRYIVTNFVGEHVVMPKGDLQALIQHRLAMDTPRYEELKAKHFVLDASSSSAVDLLATKYRTKQHLMASLTSLFMFVVTLRCEHSCPYCQVSRRSKDKQAFDMSREDALAGIELVFSSPSHCVKIEFQGGEPLLNWELIQFIVLEAESRNATAEKHLAFVITTNLALVNREMLEFCREHKIQISTSLDGPQVLHNANRPRPGNDSHERTVQGIQLARDILGEYEVAALMTTTEASLDQVEAIIDEYVLQGFNAIFLRSLSPYGFAVKTRAISGYNVEAWIDFYKRGLEHVFNLNMRGIPFVEEYAALLLQKVLTPYPTGYVDLQSPAGMGLSCMAINYDGNVYASDEARMLAEMKDATFQLGHVQTHTLEMLLTGDYILETVSSTMTEGMPLCADCGFQPYCGSDPVFHHATQNKDAVGLKPASSFCRKNMEILRHLIQLMEDDPMRGAILQSWVR